ncbi:hypothetical protein P879_07483 [Paragonimus westermani]|uniref:exodeoxyribonuclease III n=1 Tax=Paragonimus westermani TaxID=34504 RepID=A0A8T0D101_9TREM|nr:hypothetical protein P879_07483 [Paragonimus westermani]
MVKRQSNIETKKLTKPKRARGTSSDSSATESKTSIAHADCFKSMFPWCQNYPGCVPSMMSSTITKWNFKLCSWNVNGLRAWLKAGGLSYLTEELPDVLGIQETKCSIKKVPAEAKCSGYEAFWSSADKEGYAGTGLYSKLVPLNVTYGIGDSVHDTEGRVITAEYEKFYYVIAYVPNSGQGLKRLPYRHNQWDPDFISYLKKLDAIKPLIVGGDLNVAHQEIDLANPASNRKSAGFTDEERSDFTQLLAEVNLVDTYRTLYPSRDKAYTFWNYRQGARPKNTGWRLDYFLVSKRLMDHVCDHEIRCGILGSDHCPIVLYMNL